MLVYSEGCDFHFDIATISWMFEDKPCGRWVTQRYNEKFSITYDSIQLERHVDFIYSISSIILAGLIGISTLFQLRKANMVSNAILVEFNFSIRVFAF